MCIDFYINRFEGAEQDMPLVRLVLNKCNVATSCEIVNRDFLRRKLSCRVVWHVQRFGIFSLQFWTQELGVLQTWRLVRDNVPGRMRMTLHRWCCPWLNTNVNMESTRTEDSMSTREYKTSKRVLWKLSWVRGGGLTCSNRFGIFDS